MADAASLDEMPPRSGARRLRDSVWPVGNPCDELPLSVSDALGWCEQGPGQVRTGPSDVSAAPWNVRSGLSEGASRSFGTCPLPSRHVRTPPRPVPNALKRWGASLSARRRRKSGVALSLCAALSKNLWDASPTWIHERSQCIR